MNKTIKQHKRPGHKKGRAFFLSGSHLEASGSNHEPVSNLEDAAMIVSHLEASGTGNIIRYTRYRKLEILGVLEAVGPLFFVRYTLYTIL